MSANGTLWLARCPLLTLKLCQFETEPATSETAATEALRAHVNAHHHSDLVTFAAAHAEALTRYVKAAPWPE